MTSKRKSKLKIVENIPKLTVENIENVYEKTFNNEKKDDDDEKNNIENERLFNTFLLEKEKLNNEIITKNEKQFTNLYPSLDDSEFNIKIALKKEFNDNKYDGNIYDIEEQAKKLCEADFELDPHQMFVRNFLSFQTPYNSLLLYHGLGTGKTCSAISVAEEMRVYLKQIGIQQRIIVVASPNVQENFKLQLFDERKLKLVDGLWNLKSCTGNSYLKEINPMNMRGLSKEKVANQIKKLINLSYLFLGYTEFANLISKKSNVEDGDLKPKQKLQLMIKKLKKNFNNRLIIIDEVHNIRISDDKQDKRVAQELFKLVKYVDNLRLLLLSATPMYNSYKEIIWLLNLMNMNDNRATIELKDVFDKNGNFLISADGQNIGEELLRRKATGYVSFVRGENPYTFPYRIFPNLFDPSHTFKELDYPRVQLNGKPIIQPLEHINLFVNNCGSYQEKAYMYIISQIKEKYAKNKKGLPSFENMDSFGYIVLQKPLLALNMVYPNKLLDTDSDNFDSKFLLGSEGLRRTMKYTETSNPPTKKNFEYKSNIKSEFGNIFSTNEIGKYSSKIKSITESVKNSEGIILIYSQFIDGGVIPVALALEEIGFTRFGDKASNLFKEPPTQQIDAISGIPKDKMENKELFKPAKYTMITGEKSLSPDKNFDLKNLTDEDNKNGEKIKVVIISMTGSEGIDFKNLRQVHILEPWYNLSLIEQIIGRAVRTCSHKQLPFRKRNVEIFLYGTLFNESEEESADLYIYRLAEMKAVQIGRVSRLLKENSVDCILNISQTNFSEEIMNKIVEQELSNKKVIEFPIGDKPNTVSCDYMDTCSFRCKPFKEIKEDEIKLDTFDESFIMMNSDKIIQRIKDLYRMKFFYKKEMLIKEINVIKNYPLVQINAALDIMINDENEFLTDLYDRLGKLINIGDYYLFQPFELNNPNISAYDRRNPINYKNKEIIFPIADEQIIIKPEIIQDKPSKSKNNVLDNKIIEIMETNYLIGKENISKLNRGEDNWYKFAAKLNSTGFLEKEFNISKMDYENFLINHILDYLIFDELKSILEYLYFTEDLSDFEKKIKEEINKKILSVDDLEGILIPDDDKPLLLIKDDEKKEWIKGKQEDYIDFSKEIKSLIIPLKELNQFVGFINSFKNQYNIFKVKNMEDKRSKGARCDQSGKNESIKILNKIIGENKYDVSNTKGQTKIEFCVMQEMILRKKNSVKENNKTWFLDPTQSVINKIEKASF